MLPKENSILIKICLIIWLQILNRKQFVNGDEEVASDLNIMPIEVDPNFKNFKYIGIKILPDVSSITKLNEPHLIKDFLKTGGLSTLEYDGYKIVRDVPFSIIVPQIDIKTIEKPRLKEFILEHLIPGIAFGEYNSDVLYGNSNGHKIQFDHSDLKWTLNTLKIKQKIKFNENLTVIFVDGVLADKRAAFSKRNIQEHNRYNEPQRLEMKNISTKAEQTSTKSSAKSSPLMAFLSNMKSGTKVFQHFLLKSNLTQIMDDGYYTILIPADSAFQRWHPIDWGFYPFSVQDFTENILRNHFLPPPATLLNGSSDSRTGNKIYSPLRISDIKNNAKITIKTLGGETVTFQSIPTPSVNNVTILADYTLPNGNEILIISEVLFVSEGVVSKLHQMHKDKETPPLLAFPWFGAQFLSHSFLALERDSRFTQITRYLNNAEIAPYVSGANYTFFVPEDGAFEKHGFETIPDEILASPKGIKMLLNHFVKGRLYNKDLKDNEIFETIGGGLIKVQRKFDNKVFVNMAKITESEIFVYNLGTMFYIDDILFGEMLREYFSTTSPRIPVSTTITTKLSSSSLFVTTTPNKLLTHLHPLLTSVSYDVEIVPNEYITESTATASDIILQDRKPHIRLEQSSSFEDELDEDEIITPKALPIKFASKN